jgi:hypothetical protein
MRTASWINPTTVWKSASFMPLDVSAGAPKTIDIQAYLSVKM